MTRHHPLPGDMWAHTTDHFTTYPPPTITDVWHFAHAWATDYLTEHYPTGLCPNCDHLDPETIATIIVRDSADLHLTDTEHTQYRAACTPNNPLPNHIRAALTFRLITACETEIIICETTNPPWHTVQNEHAPECPTYNHDDHEQWITYRLTT